MPDCRRDARPKSTPACHLERVSPRTSRKVPTGTKARFSRRTVSFLRWAFRFRDLGGRSTQGDMKSATRVTVRCRCRCRCRCPRAAVPAADSLGTGLLVRLRRPSVVPSAWSRGWRIGRAATTPMGRRRPPSAPGKDFRIARPGGARQRHCAERVALPVGCAGTMACPARPSEAPVLPTRDSLCRSCGRCR